METGLGLIGDDATGLLAAMLQGMQPERHEIRGIGEANDPENPAFFLSLSQSFRGSNGWAGKRRIWPPIRLLLRG